MTASGAERPVVPAINGVTPSLWFDDNADDAVDFYVAIFPDAVRFGERGDAPSVVVEFELAGRRYQAINGGPHYVQTPAVSFSISCVDQAAVDYFWEWLGDGGTELECGWITDRFGVTWQVVPQRLVELLSDPDPDLAERVRQAMLGMIKLDVAGLEAAAAAV